MSRGEIIKIWIIIIALTSVVSLALFVFGVDALLVGPFCSVLGCFIHLQKFSTEDIESSTKVAIERNTKLEEIFCEGLILGFRASKIEQGILVNEHGKVLYKTDQLDQLLSLEKTYASIKDWPEDLYDQVQNIFELAKSGNVQDEHTLSILNNSKVQNLPVRIFENPFNGELIFGVYMENLQSNRELETLSRFSSGVAHDLNNLLSSIVGSLSLLERQTQTTINERQLKLLMNIRGAAKRGTKLSQDLLNFGKAIRGVAQTNSVNIRTLIDNALESVSSFEQVLRCEFDLALQRDLWVQGSDEGLHQVLMNLLYNSFDAMPKGGKITISAYDDEKDPNFVNFIIQDSGSGMPAEVLSNIFEPFYSTKKSAKPGEFFGGSGLGLSNARALVIAWGGQMTCESVLGKGTSFKIKLKKGMPVMQEATVH